MKLEQQLLTNREWICNNNYGLTGNEIRTTTNDQHGMKLEQQLLINRLEVRTTPIDQQGMNLEQHLLINREWSCNDNNWSTGNEVRAATTDQLRMKL